MTEHRPKHSTANL